MKSERQFDRIALCCCGVGLRDGQLRGPERTAARHRPRSAWVALPSLHFGLLRVSRCCPRPFQHQSWSNSGRVRRQRNGPAAPGGAIAGARTAGWRIAPPCAGRRSQKLASASPRPFFASLKQFFSRTLTPRKRSCPSPCNIKAGRTRGVASKARWPGRQRGDFRRLRAKNRESRTPRRPRSQARA